MSEYTRGKRYVTMKTKWSTLEELRFWQQLGGEGRKQLVFKGSYIQNNSLGWTTKRKKLHISRRILKQLLTKHLRSHSTMQTQTVFCKGYTNKGR